MSHHENNHHKDAAPQHQMERYSYSFEPAEPAPVRIKKRRPALKAAAFIMCGLALSLGGGFAGSYLTILRQAPVQESNGGAHELPAVAQDTFKTPVASVNPGGGQMTLTELFEGASPAVVAIATETTGRNIFGQIVNLPAAGSGFILSEDGYIATNNHVISGADSITVVLDDGTRYEAELIGSDAATDIAVIKIDAKGLSYLTFGDSGLIKVGQQVAAIGNPLGELANSFTVGYISALDRELNIDGIPRNMLQTDVSINRGNSGGPLLDLSGRVIGVVTAKSVGQNVEGLGFAIPSNKAAAIVEQLIEKGYVSGRAVMGVRLSTRSSSNSRTYVCVESVEPGSAAEKAGVMTEDIILFANDIYIAATSDLTAILAGLSPGDKLTLDVQRGRTKQTLTLTLDEFTPSAAAPETPPDTDSESDIPWTFPFRDVGPALDPAS